MKIFSNHPISFPYLFFEVLLCSHWGAAYFPCVPYYQSADFHHSDYHGSSIMVTMVSLFDDFSITGLISSCCRATVDPMEKKVSLCEHHCPLHHYC